MCSGFPTETIDFLHDLRVANSKEWFDDNRARYDDFYIAPAKEFVVAAGDALTELVPDIVAEPKVNGSIFKVNRDVRFSKDKTPYKDHIDFRFWQGDRKTAPSALMFRITLEDYGIATGAPGFDKDRLAAFRTAATADWSTLRAAVERVEQAGYHLDGEELKKVPSGFDPVDDIQARLLRHKGLMVGRGIAHGPELHSPELIDVLMERWSEVLPVHRWLVNHL